MHWFENFEARHFDTQGARIHAHVSTGLPAGRPALLLLHGFPHTHVMWHRVAQLLQQDFYLVMPDLRGYGDSSKAPGLADHSNYSKRAMAQDMVDVMDALGIAQFALCGHDRGGRALQAQSAGKGGGKIACDTLVLWGQRGVVNRLFKPLDLWQAQCAGRVTGYTLPAGHFIPEELPGEVAQGLALFFQNT